MRPRDISSFPSRPNRPYLSDPTTPSHLAPMLVPRLNVLVRAVRRRGAEEEDGVDGDAQPAAVGRGAGAGLGGARVGPAERLWLGVALAAVELADEHAAQDLARLVAVAHVLEGLGGVLAAHVEEDLFAAAVKEDRSVQCLVL